METFTCSKYNNRIRQHERKIQSRIDSINYILELHDDLIKSYLSDFFVKELWTKIPPKWWSVLKDSEPQELSALLSVNTWKVKRMWPLSLLAHRAAIAALSLHRHPQVGDGENESVSKENHVHTLDHCFRRHVKPKKRHEIIRMAETVTRTCEPLGCQHVVDFGAGQGHLSRLLTFGYGLKVTTIEAAGVHATKANKFDSETKKDIDKGRVGKRRERTKQSDTVCMKQPNTSDLPNHLVIWVEPDIKVADFLHKIQLTDSKNNAKEPGSERVIIDSHGTSSEFIRVENNLETQATSMHCHSNTNGSLCNDSNGCSVTAPHFMVTGLHACGDLSATLLRVFVQCPPARAVVSVACCYMKLSVGGSSGDKDLGFPMSDYLRHRASPAHSWEARELACHFADAYHQRLLDNEDCLRSHVYRAALQEILLHKDPLYSHGSTKLTFKKLLSLPFEQYVQKALQKLGLSTDVPTEVLEQAESRLNQWKDVVALYTLRLSLAPLIESLLLLDKMLYLLENGIQCRLEPIFDPCVSPRNFALIGIKRNI